ncbi:MAG: hypothetical protein ACREM8_01545, partial [Vulcanimicrobiaceae bacterium]
MKLSPVGDLSRSSIACAIVVALIGAGLPTPAPGADAMPVVSRVAGDVTIQSTAGGARSVGIPERTSEGDTITTKPNGLADVDFAEVGSMRIGPATVARVQQMSGVPAIRLVSGDLCVDVEQSTIAIGVGNLAITPVSAPTIFSVVAGEGGPSIIVYVGQVKALGSGAPVTASAGDAFGINSGGIAALTNFEPLQKRLGALQCPTAATIAHARTLAEKPVALGDGSSHGGGGGGAVFGILGGVGLLAAAAGGAGGGSKGNAVPAVPGVVSTTPPPAT